MFGSDIHIFEIIADLGLLLAALILGFLWIKLKQKQHRNLAQMNLIQNKIESLRIKEEKFNQLKSHFLARINHQMRTPLTAILGYTELLLLPETPLEKFKPSMLAIQHQGHYLLNFLQYLTDLVEIESGTLKLTMESCPPQAIVEDAIGHALQGQTNKIKFEVVFKSSIPEKIITDRKRILQILSNLIKVAAKNTNEGLIKILVSRPGEEAESNFLKFSVLYNGEPVPLEILDHLKDPFYFDSAYQKNTWMDDKLVISKMLSELMGGNFSFHRDPEGGNVISFTIITNRQESASSRPSIIIKAESDQFDHSSLAPLKDKSILLVDDNEDAQILIAFHLKQAGATVEKAYNGITGYQMAMAALKNGRPYDVILMDIEMPEMSGLEATQKLRDQYYFTPILALTAYGTQDEANKCLNAGCNDIIVKPINGENLIKKVVASIDAFSKGI